MTAPNAAATITPERVRWFAEYYKTNPACGVFHVCLSDGNWTIGAKLWDPVHGDRRNWDSELREAADWFDQLSPSQRRRLAQKAKDLAHTVVR